MTYGEAFTVQPFNNLVVTQTFTGAQLKEVLEQQFAATPGETCHAAGPPGLDGFTYTYSTERSSWAPASATSR